MTFQGRIVRDPEICGGQPVVRGTRVLVRTILGYLAPHLVCILPRPLGLQELHTAPAKDFLRFPPVH